MDFEPGATRRNVASISGLTIRSLYLCAEQKVISTLGVLLPISILTTIKRNTVHAIVTPLISLTANPWSRISIISAKGFTSAANLMVN